MRQKEKQIIPHSTTSQNDWQYQYPLPLPARLQQWSKTVKDCRSSPIGWANRWQTVSQDDFLIQGVSPFKPEGSDP